MNEPKGEKKRRAACNDRQSGKTERRTGRKNAGNRTRKLPKATQTRKEIRNNRQVNTGPGTPAGVAELVRKNWKWRIDNARRQHQDETNGGRAAGNDRKSGQTERRRVRKPSGERVETLKAELIRGRNQKERKLIRHCRTLANMKETME